jgi:hypothetical protein
LKGRAKFKPPLRAEDQRLPDFLSRRLLQKPGVIGVSGFAQKVLLHVSLI